MNLSLRVLVMEDSKLQALDYEIFLKDLGYEEVLVVDSAEKALKVFYSFKPDILILDIELNGELDGIEFAEYVRKEEVFIIFATSHNDKSVYERAKSIHHFAYLVKPINKISLESILCSANKYRQKNEKQVFLDDLDNIFIKTNGKLLKLKIEDVLAIRADGNYCSFITPAKKIILKAPLYKLKKILDPQLFFQTHRGCIINLKKVDSILLSEGVITIGSHRFPLGDKYKPDLVKKLNLL